MNLKDAKLTNNGDCKGEGSSIMRKKMCNNKGLTLVELVIAITLFMIVVAPIMNTLICSARVNRNSRKLMIATDVAQNIIEGYSEMTFETICSGVKTAQTSPLTGSIRFSSINGDKYNQSATWYNVTAPSNYKFYLDHVEFTADDSSGTIYNEKTVDMVSQNSLTNMMMQLEEKTALRGISANSVSDQSVCAMVVSCNVVKADGSTTTSDEDAVVFMNYMNIEADTGYSFNATACIFPVNQATTGYILGDTEIANPKDIYYNSYVIKVSVYDADSVSADGFGSPVVTLLGGIAGK